METEIEWKLSRSESVAKDRAFMEPVVENERKMKISRGELG
jgi:hypothetical protein